MSLVATLGPANTFSERAAFRFIEECGLDHSVKLCPTIGKAFDSVGDRCDYAILPIENMAEGYVTSVLDLLINSNLSIVHPKKKTIW